MKKLFASILFILLGFTFTQVNAQENKAKSKATQNAPKAKLKSDGTPDMRYKENKEGTKTTTKHLKKDGTPDKRYKENKK